VKLEELPRIKGWGHNTARLRFDDKVAESGTPLRAAARAPHDHRRLRAPASRT
jgi:hypothetical protein